jgi:hypothetical protein
MDNPDPSLGSVSSDLSSYPLRRRGRRLLRTHRDHVPLEQGVKDVLGQRKNTINVPDSDNPVQPQRQIRAMFRKALESMPATDTIEDIIEGLGETSKSTKEVSKAATQHRDIGGSKIKAKGVLTSLREMSSNPGKRSRLLITLMGNLPILTKIPRLQARMCPVAGILKMRKS